MALKKFGIILILAGLGPLALAQEGSLYQREHFVQNGDTGAYRILYPENFNKEVAYPLVVFLHGSGERGNDNERQLMHGSHLFVKPEHRTRFPAIIIFPQCPQEDYWANVIVDRSSYPIGLRFQYDKGPTQALKSVMALLDQISDKPFIDSSRIYAMGLSMGGMGTYELLSRKPDFFAAAVAICGGGDPKSTKKYAQKIPIWAFHGSKDNVVAPQQSIDMVSALLENGGFPRFTLYGNADHNSWDPAFAETELLPWLFSHSLKK